MIANSVETDRLQMSFIHIGGSQTHAKLGNHVPQELKPEMFAALRHDSSRALIQNSCRVGTRVVRAQLQ